MLRTLNRKQWVAYLKTLRLNRGLARAERSVQLRQEPGSGDPGLTNEEMLQVVDAAWQARDAAGAFVVVGYSTLEYATRLALMLGRGADVHVYDSFSGPPAPGPEDYPSGCGPDPREGEVPPCDRPPQNPPLPSMYGPAWVSQLPTPEVTAFWAAMSAAGARPAITHQGDFFAQQWPGSVAFAVVDASMYRPTLDALREVTRRLSVGGIMMVRMSDDEPGVEAATECFDFGDLESFMVPGFAVFQRGE